ncbi:folate-binding protein YgfZ [uncultured Caulobacter sp.]|uniref:CAF17-like 4Fe-4S cluster assembly/insertion protein YgfZ n=1 Tax=uncultured Caulobacter sp. TaxID=158749 RepID=UPI00261C70DA|nr:folate-binding protein YgfZ [uncultured Caulobacter sp.]
MVAMIIARLTSRAVIAVSGPDWRSFLQGLLTQDVETLAPGELRFGALLTPQGKLLFDLFIAGTDDGALLDVAAARREALLQRLSIYRLRAKVALEASDRPVLAVFGGALAGEGLYADPRLPALGARAYDDRPASADEDAYDAHRLALGVPGPADWGEETTYPIEADFDLLAGIDFKKGCFVGQETTSRMKRRGTIKNRMLPIVFDGPSPAFGAEVLAGALRAGEVLSGRDGRAMALLRLDRIEDVALTVEGRPVTVERPAWLT